MTDSLNSQHESLLIEAAELLTRLQTDEAATIVDVRKPGPWQHSDIKIRGAVRIDPAELPLGAGWPKDHLLAFY